MPTIHATSRLLLSLPLPLAFAPLLPGTGCGDVDTEDPTITSTSGCSPASCPVDSTESSTGGSTTDATDTSTTDDSTSSGSSSTGPDGEPDPAPLPDLMEPEQDCGDGVPGPDELCLAEPTAHAVASPSSVTVADVTGDSLLDVLYTSRTDHAVGVLINKGDGTLAAPWIRPLAAEGDGDLLLAGHPHRITVGQLYDPPVTVIGTVNDLTDNWSFMNATGDPDAPLSEPERFDSDLIGRALSLVIGDFDGSGEGDLLLGALTTPNPFTIAIGWVADQGIHTALIQPSILPSALASGDLDGDGLSEFVAADRHADALGFLRLVPDGPVFGHVATLQPVSAGPPIDVAMVDLDDDGVDALVVLHAHATCPDGSEPDACVPGRVSVYPAPLGPWDEVDPSHTSYVIGRGPRDLAAGDVNGDGAPDLVIANAIGGDVTFLLGDGEGGFYASHTREAAAGLFRIALADLNGDGVDDLITAHEQDEHLLVSLSWP